MAAQPSAGKRSSPERAIQGLVLFSTALGVLFLAQVYGTLPSLVFDFVAVGLALFVVDSILTFVAPWASYVLAFALAVSALASSLPQSSHYAFLANGQLVPSATFLFGSAAQVLLIAAVLYHFTLGKRRGS